MKNFVLRQIIVLLLIAAGSGTALAQPPDTKAAADAFGNCLDLFFESEQSRAASVDDALRQCEQEQEALQRTMPPEIYRSAITHAKNKVSERISERQ